VGDHDISIATDTPFAALYKISKVIRHNNYNSITSNNDIALIQTTEPFKWKRTVGPTCLPFIYAGYDSYFEGYSLTGKIS